MRQDRLRALVVTGGALGLRPGELLGLSWRDIDLDAGVASPPTFEAENNALVWIS